MNYRIYSPEHAAALCAYRLPPEQAAFTLQPFERIDADGNIDAGDDGLAITLFSDKGAAAGLFILDDGSDKFDYTGNVNAVLLRSLSLNPAYQGQGLAKRAFVSSMLAELLREYFPCADEVVLGVNEDNQAVYCLYLHAGFADSGRFFNGCKGKQHILSKRF